MWCPHELSTCKNDFSRATTTSTVTCSSGQARCSKQPVTCSAEELCQCRDHVVRMASTLCHAQVESGRSYQAQEGGERSSRSGWGHQPLSSDFCKARKTTSRIRTGRQRSPQEQTLKRSKDEPWETRGQQLSGCSKMRPGLISHPLG